METCQSSTDKNMWLILQKWGSSLLFLLLIIVAYRLLRIQHILCQVSTDAPCPNEHHLSELKNTPIFFSNLYKNSVIETYGQAHNLTLKKYKIYLPNIVELNFTKNPLVYSIQLNAAEVYVVSENGVVGILSVPPDLPIIKVQTAVALFPNSDLILEPRLHIFFLSFIAYQATNTQLATDLTLQEDFAELRSVDGVHIFVPYENPEKKLWQLQQILQSQTLTNQNEPLREIDLRFDLPVLRTQQ